MEPAKDRTLAAAIAGRIKQIREKLVMTQDEFAAATGVRRNHISSIETGRAEPSLEVIVGVLLLDINLSGNGAFGEYSRPINPAWLLLGPQIDPDMWGSRRFIPNSDTARMMAQHFARSIQSFGGAYARRVEGHSSDTSGDGAWFMIPAPWELPTRE